MVAMCLFYHLFIIIFLFHAIFYFTLILKDLIFYQKINTTDSGPIAKNLTKGFKY